jgi:hypothetical protein
MTEELWPVVVGKFEKPRCLEDTKQYLCDYMHG